MHGPVIPVSYEDRLRHLAGVWQTSGALHAVLLRLGRPNCRRAVCMAFCMIRGLSAPPRTPRKKGVFGSSAKGQSSE